MIHPKHMLPETLTSLDLHNRKMLDKLFDRVYDGISKPVFYLFQSSDGTVLVLGSDAPFSSDQAMLYVKTLFRLNNNDEFTWCILPSGGRGYGDIDTLLVLQRMG